MKANISSTKRISSFHIHQAVGVTSYFLSWITFPQNNCWTCSEFFTPSLKQGKLQLRVMRGNEMMRLDSPLGKVENSQQSVFGSAALCDRMERPSTLENTQGAYKRLNYSCPTLILSSSELIYLPGWNSKVLTWSFSPARTLSATSYVSSSLSSFLNGLVNWNSPPCSGCWSIRVVDQWLSSKCQLWANPSWNKNHFNSFYLIQGP